MANSRHQTTTTVWSTPQTEAQKNYFSRMGGFRRLLTVGITIFIALCIALDLAGAISLSEATIGRVTDNVFILKGIPFILLNALHIIGRKALETHLYYKWDTDPQTNLSLAYAIVPYAAILVLGIFGSQQYFSGFVTPVEEKDKSSIDSRVAGLKEAAKSDYNAAINAANAAFDASKKAANASANADIASQNKRRKKTAGDIAVINKEIRKINAEKDAKIAKAEEVKAADIAAAAAAQKMAFDAANNEHQSGISAANSHNEKELSRFDSEKAKANSFSYYINIIVLLLTIMLIRQKVYIDTKSGIFPIRQYTELDAHGGVLAQAQSVFSDIFSLNMLNMLSAIHRAGVPKEVKTFDGKVVFTQEGKTKDEEKGAF